MLKILMVVRWPVGGIRTFLKYVYSSWGHEKIQFHFLVPNLPEVNILDVQLSDIDTVWHLTSTGEPTFIEFTKKIFDVVGKNNFDIIHSHGFTSAIAVSPLVPFIKAKSIFTSHDVLSEKQFEGIKGLIKKTIITLALNRYEKIHSVSNDAEHNLLKVLPRINRKKTLVILNAVDTERFYSAKAISLKSHLGLPDDVVVIGFFGRFMSQKGFKYLISAIDSLEKKQSKKYKVVCFGAGAFIREEKEKIDGLGLSEAFYFHDFVPDIAPYVKGCDLVVMPSLWEACSLLAMEVMAAGTPLVASSCIGLREICEGSPAIMITPADARSLEDGIVAVSRLNRKIFEDYATIAKDLFSVKITQDKMKSLYRDVVG